MAVPVALVCSLLQPAIGHLSVEVVAGHQPAKLAAIEGHWETGPMDLTLAGWVDEDSGETYALGIPGGVGLLLDLDPGKEYVGLNDFPADERPGMPNAVFQFYHIMVACGMAQWRRCWRCRRSCARPATSALSSPRA